MRAVGHSVRLVRSDTKRGEARLVRLDGNGRAASGDDAQKGRVEVGKGQMAIGPVGKHDPWWRGTAEGSHKERLVGVHTPHRVHPATNLCTCTPRTLPFPLPYLEEDSLARGQLVEVVGSEVHRGGGDDAHGENGNYRLHG